MRTYTPEQRERSRTRQAAWYQANKAQQAASIRRRLYGIEPEDFERMIEQRHNRCAVCDFEFSTDSNRATRPHVDHDHRTGKVRGLLCSSCNRSIGLLGDTAEALRRVVAYLEATE